MIKESKILSIVKALAFFAIYFGIQTAIASVFAFFWAFQISFRYAASGMAAEELMEIITKEMSELALKDAMLMTLIADALVILVIVLFVALRKKSEKGLADKAIFKGFAPETGIIALLMGIFGSLALNIFMNLLPEKLLHNYEDATEVYNAGGFVTYLLAGVIVAPICEELVFRGMMQTRLQRGFSAIPAIAITALVFGIIHGNPVQIVYAALLGVLLGFAFKRSGSIWVSILVHFGFNATSIPSYLASYTSVNPFSNPVVEMIYGSATYASIPVLILLVWMFVLRTKTEKTPEEQL